MSPAPRTPRTTWIARAPWAIFAGVALLSISCSGGGGGSAETQPAAPVPAVASDDANRQDASQPAAARNEAPAAGSGARKSAVFSDVELSPAAKIQAEKFNCICGCNLKLGKCFCEKTPGSIDMKEHLQKLVDQGLSPKEIEEGMIAKYGKEVLP